MSGSHSWPDPQVRIAAAIIAGNLVSILSRGPAQMLISSLLNIWILWWPGRNDRPAAAMIEKEAENNSIDQTIDIARRGAY
jgi:hypothetical protein